MEEEANSHLHSDYGSLLSEFGSHDKNHQHRNSNSTKSGFSPQIKLFVLFTVVIVISTFAISTNFGDQNLVDSITNFVGGPKNGNTTKSKVDRVEPTEANLPSFSFTLHRVGYDPLIYFTSNVTNATYKVFENYIGIVEPYSLTNMYMEDPISETTYKFRITNSSGHNFYGQYSETENHPVQINCSPYEELDVSVYAFTGKSLTGKASGKLLCLYVRREIRDLIEADLAATMDAMFTLWSTSEAEGQSKYGSNFHRSNYFSEAHMFNAAQQDADHIHEGQGFLPQHLKLTNMFELAMQSVDPSVSLPYWDYTQDSTSTGYTVLKESYMFQPETFGSLSEPMDSYWGWTYRNDSILDAAIPDGRWSNIKADLNVKYETLGNSFGYLRGPWNSNPSPYISRFAISHTTLPTCSSFYNMLLYTSLKQFNNIAPFAPHSSTHGGIGAVYGCDMLDSFTDEGLISSDANQRRICKKWGFYLKEFYRANLLTKRDSCNVTSLDYEGISCGFKCNPDTLANLTLAIKGQIKPDYMSSTIDTEGWEKLRDFICEGDGYRIFVGDHLEAASPSDPSFWPIHPTLDRLLQAKYISGGFEDAVWPTDPDDVCDKAKCYESTYDSKGYYTECCYGHYEYDQLLDFVNGDKNAGFGLTNHEMMRILNPTNTNYSLPYVYNHFQWSHCEEDFSALLDY